MGLILLHSDDVEASRAFKDAFGSAGLVLETHGECVAAHGTLTGYPTVLYEDSAGARHALYNPASMQDVDTWVWSLVNQPVQGKTVFTRLEFMNLFTLAELAAAKEAAKTDPIMDVIWTKVGVAEEVVTTDPVTIDAVGYLTTAPAGSPVLTAERAAAILAGQAPA